MFFTGFKVAVKLKFIVSRNGRSTTRNVRSVTRNGDLMALQKHLHGIARTFAREINKRCKCIYSEFCCNFVED